MSPVTPLGTCAVLADVSQNWSIPTARTGEVVSDPTNVAELQELPAAVRTRVLRRAAIAAGVPAGALSAAHVEAIDALITDWHGQRAISLPGGLEAHRADGA